MRGKYLGELEELVLLTTGAVGEKAYAVSILDEIQEKTGRKINISAVHSALRRLEEKGFLKSIMGGATTERGGRRKRIFELTHGGKSAINQIKELRNKLWDQIPAMATNQ